MTSSTDNFIRNLLAQMTLDEKIGQLNQYHARDHQAPQVIRAGLAGSIINAAGALTGQGFSLSATVEQHNALQQMALESRLKIPLLFGRDVIHGYRTIFPIPLAQAASFDPSLAEQAAAVAAREATAEGVKWTFAPMLDIARDPRWGRIAEGNGEDPFLGAQFGSAVVRGFQGDDLAAPERMIACAKHYAGYGSAEGGRDYDNGEISDTTLRDVYLPPFRAAVNAGVGSLMSAFVDLNGMPATANRYLLTDILRGEWDFDGFIVSDWESVRELVAHGIAADEAEAAQLALHAGVDMDMVSGVYLNHLAAQVQSGRVSQAELDEAVLNILRIKARAGLFEHPFTDPQRHTRELLTPAARQLARKLASRSMVLLKNQSDLLPLEGFSRVLVAGDFVHARDELFGTWSPDGHAQDVTPLDQAVRQSAPPDVDLWFIRNNDLALTLAHQADAVVLLLGEHPSRSGENANVSDLGLPPGQADFLEKMAAIGKPLVVVIFAGRPLAIPRAAMLADALLYAWHPGIEGGSALGDVLFGKEEPGGRLPVTFPRATGQVPIYYNHKNSGRPLHPQGPFRNRYVDLPDGPLFPFGYGLTYTQFDYGDLRLSSPRLNGKLEISATVTNTGKRAGSEVVQLYVRDLVGSLTRPVRELKGFERIHLQPGESRAINFSIQEEQLAFTRADGSYGVEAGDFHFWVAPHSRAGLQGEFRL
ncbi:MAG: glycoside hydrolase family 3 N-terminal domain-containing protein [Anaerolineaceae bacterium]